jgi:PKD repeat protein
LTPTRTQLGTNGVTVRVIDGNGGFATQLFSIEVGAANQPPSIVSAPSLNATEASTYTYDVDATDPDGDAPTYSLGVAPAGMTIDPVSGMVQWTPTSAQLGANAVTVRADDGNGGFATQSYSIQVAATNLAPVADAGGPYTGTAGVPLVFDGSDSMDPDGTIVSYDWDFGDGSAGNGPTPSHTYFAEGTFVVALTVTDDSGAMETATATVVINLANLSPDVDPGGPYSGTAGLALTLDGSGSVDPDGTIVSYDWDFGDGGMGSGSALNHTYLAAGTYNVTLTVTDDDGATDTAMTTAVVSESPTNNAPVCTAAFPSTDLIWPPNHKFVPVTVHGVTDSDGDPVSMSIDSIFQDEPVNTYGDGDTARDGRGIGTTVAEIRAERSGTKKVPGNGRVYHIGFTANDGRGATCSGSVAVVVPHDVNDIPIDDGALYDSTIP